MTLIRTEPFVPLTSAVPASAGERVDFQATVISQPNHIQKLHSIDAAGSATPPVLGATVRNSACEPHIAVQREGDRVTGIRIQCSCGQIIDLACVYRQESAPAKA